MWDLPKPGVQPVALALPGGFLNIRLPWKPEGGVLKQIVLEPFVVV